MIDLTKGLPNAIIGSNGEPILLNTDYRLWIRFYKDLESQAQSVDISYLFKSNPPVIDEHIMKELTSFLYNPSVTPNFSGSSNVKTMDYILDGEYIFSALYQTYGIDIIEMDMHWHKFQALCNNINGEKTLWGTAKQYRGYKKPSKQDTYEKQCQAMKKAWTFPVVQSVEQTEEKKRKIAEFDELFKNTYYKGGGS